MIHPDKNKLGKLPKWAQTYVNELYRELRESENRNGELIKEREDTGKSNLVWEDSKGDEHDLPEFCTIKFYVGDEHVSVSFRNDGENRVVDVSSSSSVIYTEPRSSNRIQVGPVTT